MQAPMGNFIYLYHPVKCKVSIKNPLEILVYTVRYTFANAMHVTKTLLRLTETPLPRDCPQLHTTVNAPHLCYMLQHKVNIRNLINQCYKSVTGAV